MTPPEDTLLRRLKDETAALHLRIEGVVPLLSPALDRPTYRAYLDRFFGYLRPLEALLSVYRARWERCGLDYEARRKAHLLEHDLLALGASPTELEGLPGCPSLPAASTFDEAWGCLYVLEGSTLGGQVIVRTLEPRLGLTRTAGLAFLNGYGEQTGPSWKAFGAALARHEATGCDPAAVVRGACATFETQMAWLSAEPLRA